MKSARVVGDVLGKFHPHSDTAAYDALVRMAQDFSQRYPLVDGQGNFGSRDGDGAAAMRYTEARLAPIARLLLDELDEGTVDFIPNYDGSTEEPRCCRRACRSCCSTAPRHRGGPGHRDSEPQPARGGGRRGRADPRREALRRRAVRRCVPGPDYPGGGQIISSTEEIRAAYATGRGSLKVRARWKIEDLARGQWQLVVTELPPGTSAQKVLEEIEELTNPKVKAGKKTVSHEQAQLKATVLSVLDAVRDESSKDAPVRLVFEPKTRTDRRRRSSSATLLAHTSLETSAPINLTMVGRDGRPTQKSLRQMLLEWVAFRQATVQRRSQHRLRQGARSHPHARRPAAGAAEHRRGDPHHPQRRRAQAGADRSASSSASGQADDILDMRLRQLARLEAIKIEQELKEMREEQGKLEDILEQPGGAQAHRDQGDRGRRQGARRRAPHADPGRKAPVAEIRVVDEPVTVVVSMKGWVRSMKGHEIDPASLAFKAGDALYGTFSCRSVDTLLGVRHRNGRVYSVATNTLPGGRGDGQPITSLIELESGTQPAHYFAGPGETMLMLANTGGFGLLAKAADMLTRQRGGKSFLAIEADDKLLPPVAVRRDTTSWPACR